MAFMENKKTITPIYPLTTIMTITEKQISD